jgi:hypothetical protein
MSYSVNELITNAFYLSKVRSKDFQTVGGDDITVGISLLNEVLSETSVNTKMIPYYKESIITAVIGQEMYYIAGLVEPFSLTFNMTTVRYATNDLSRRQFHSTTRIDGVVALPFNSSFERVLGGCNLYVQYLPAEPYPFKIWGKFALELLTVADLPVDMLLTYDMFYIRYLRHLLAAEICNYYGSPISPEIRLVSDRIAANINNMNVLDLTSQKLNYYDDKNGLGWAQVNLGKGFCPAD